MKHKINLDSHDDYPRIRWTASIISIILLLLFVYGMCSCAKTGVIPTETKNIPMHTDHVGVEFSQPVFNTPTPDYVYPNIYFYFDSHELTHEGTLNVISASFWLHKNKDVKVIVTGYADERGSEIYNKALSYRRAIEVKDQLIRLGVRWDRIETVAFGEVFGVSEEDHARNRRCSIMAKR